MAPGTVRVVRNGGTLPPAPAGVVPDPDLVVSTGRLERFKGHHRAIEALPVLLRTRPGARLLILGSGPYEPELHALAARLGVADRVEVRFVPPVDRDAMAAALAGAGVVVLLSDYEAHPVAVMEALAVGRPAVVLRTSGLAELAEDGWARAVEPDATPDDVAAAVLAQLDDPLQPDPALLPDWESSVAELAEVYAEVLAR
nr:glycosyltransferase [Nocardioides perillae]